MIWILSAAPNVIYYNSEFTICFPNTELVMCMKMMCIVSSPFFNEYLSFLDYIAADRKMKVTNCTRLNFGKKAFSEHGASRRSQLQLWLGRRSSQFVNDKCICFLNYSSHVFRPVAADVIVDYVLNFQDRSFYLRDIWTFCWFICNRSAQELSFDFIDRSSHFSCKDFELEIKNSFRLPNSRKPILLGMNWMTIFAQMYQKSEVENLPSSIIMKYNRKHYLTYRSIVTISKKFENSCKTNFMDWYPYVFIWFLYDTSKRARFLEYASTCDAWRQAYL